MLDEAIDLGEDVDARDVGRDEITWGSAEVVPGVRPLFGVAGESERTAVLFDGDPQDA